MLPQVKPKFQLVEGEKIFTIGSCFARHVEHVLEQYGYQFETRNRNNFVEPDECTSPNGFFNKFTTASMLNEVRWALSSDEAFPESAFVESTNGRWEDGQLPASFGSLERAKEIRARVTSVMKNITSSQLLVLTLGLVECWYDEENDLYLNVAPSAGVIKKYPGRFHVHVLDYKSNLASLNELYERVKASNPQTKLLVTLSPVPLGATFTGDDIVVANNYSKSTLRSVAADFCDGKEDVDYFPSFEAVTESAPNAAWMEDCIHVQLNLVQCVIGHFIKQYGYPALSEKVDMEKLLQTLADSPYVKES
nr:GSCFA domain-containing protein [uncultured Cohaesibacter sp.]